MTTLSSTRNGSVADAGKGHTCQPANVYYVELGVAGSIPAGVVAVLHSSEGTGQ